MITEQQQSVCCPICLFVFLKLFFDSLIGFTATTIFIVLFSWFLAEASHFYAVNVSRITEDDCGNVWRILLYDATQIATAERSTSNVTLYINYDYDSKSTDIPESTLLKIL